MYLPDQTSKIEQLKPWVKISGFTVCLSVPVSVCNNSDRSCIYVCLYVCQETPQGMYICMYVHHGCLICISSLCQRERTFQQKMFSQMLTENKPKVFVYVHSIENQSLKEYNLSYKGQNDWSWRCPLLRGSTVFAYAKVLRPLCQSSF